MFQNIRQGNTVYVLEKGEEPKLKVGQVTHITNPTPKFNSTYMPFNPETYVDMTIKVGEESLEFKQIPSNLSIANFNNSLISEDKALLSNEIEALQRNSKAVLDSVSYHEKAVQAYDDMLRELNPNMARAKEQEEKILNLESQITSVADSITELKGMLSKVLPNPQSL